MKKIKKEREKEKVSEKRKENEKSENVGQAQSSRKKEIQKEKEERKEKEEKEEEKVSFCAKQSDVRVAYCSNQPLFILLNKEACFAINDLNLSFPSVVVSLSQKFEDEFPNDVPRRLPSINAKDHQFDSIPNYTKDPIDFSSWRTCIVCRTINNIIAKIRKRILFKRGGMMRSEKHHQGNQFMFGPRHMQAKAWMINNIKRTQDWPKGSQASPTTILG